MEERSEYLSAKPWDLRKLRDLAMEVFSSIGTEKSRQRLVYDLLNALKTNDKNRFLWLILKNVNAAKTENYEKAKEFANLLGTLQFEYDAEKNFEKIAYAIVMGIMSAESKERGGSNE